MGEFDDEPGRDDSKSERESVDRLSQMWSRAMFGATGVLAALVLTIGQLGHDTVAANDELRLSLGLAVVAIPGLLLGGFVFTFPHVDHTKRLFETVLVCVVALLIFVAAAAVVTFVAWLDRLSGLLLGGAFAVVGILAEPLNQVLARRSGRVK